MALADNLLSPPILFFLLGVLASLVRADLRIPAPIPKLFSLYLLWAIGFKGGIGLAQAGWSIPVIVELSLAVGLSVAIPLWSYPLLRMKVVSHDAAAIAATYGSISAVTFIAAVNFIEREGIPYGGHMVAAMALMEAPAIIVAVALVRWHERRASRESSPAAEATPRRPHGSADIIRECLLNGPVFLLMGSLVVGLVVGPERAAPLRSFSQDIFHGVLTLFLLDMGMVAARRLGDLRKGGPPLVVFAVAMPLFNALVGAVLARAIGMQTGNALLLIVLAASASYIAVPAAVRHAIPQANISLYLPMALAVTFPFNITVGIPLYLWMARWASGQ